MSKTRSFLLFCVGEGRYALDVATVQRVVFAAEVTPLPDAPETVLGLINIAGELTPVISMRKRFSLPARDMELTDHLILTRAGGKPLALLVDKAEGVLELSEQTVTSVVPGFAGSMSAVATIPGSIVLIQDTNAFDPPPARERAWCDTDTKRGCVGVLGDRQRESGPLQHPSGGPELSRPSDADAQE